MGADIALESTTCALQLHHALPMLSSLPLAHSLKMLNVTLVAKHFHHALTRKKQPDNSLQHGE